MSETSISNPGELTVGLGFAQCALLALIIYSMAPSTGMQVAAALVGGLAAVGALKAGAIRNGWL